MALRSRTRLLLPVLLASACSLGVGAEPDQTADRLGVWVPDPTATILRAEQSGLHVPTFAIVADTGAWRTVWAQTWAEAAAPPHLPFEDFVLTSVLVLGLGDRVGSGYSVTIDSVVSYGSGQVLFATEIQPDQPCSGSPGPTSPVHMVRVPNHPPPMNYHVLPVRRPCAP
jgi:hypothetical protein